MTEERIKEETKKKHEEKPDETDAALSNQAESFGPEEKEQLKKQLAEADDKYLRLFAEFDNFRRRTENEKNELIKNANKSLIENVLPILDSFCHSEAALEKDGCSQEDLRKGFVLIHKQLEDCLAKQGVQRIQAIGQPFDPNYHEAAMQKESDQPAHTVLEELQVGYLLNEKVLRPAIVVVAK